MGLNYNPTIVPDGLVMYFDPANSRSSVGSGNTIYDLTGNSNTCTFSATPTYDVASKGNLLLAGYGTVSHTDTLWSSNQFTLSVWAKKTSGTRGIMISKDTNYIDHSYSGTTMASFYATAAYSPRQYLVYGNTSASYNEWRHYTSTYDGTTGSLYENGALIGTTNMSVEILKSTDPLNIGRWNGGTTEFSGKLGTIMTYNRALSAQEVKQNYDATKGRYIPVNNIVRNGLVLYYEMSDYRSAPFSGIYIYDQSGFANTGELFNGAAYNSLADGNIIFDGTNDYLNIPSSTLQFGTSDFSIQFWFKIPSLIDGKAIFSDGWGITNGGFLFYTYKVGASERVQFYSTSTSGAWDIADSKIIIDGPSYNTWYNIAATRIGNSFTLYSSGVAVTTFTSSLSLRNTGYPYTFGADSSASRACAVSLGSLLIYKNKGLSATEILQNYNATKSRFGL